jgi:hypothetical protein
MKQFCTLFLVALISFSALPAFAASASASSPAPVAEAPAFAKKNRMERLGEKVSRKIAKFEEKFDALRRVDLDDNLRKSLIFLVAAIAINVVAAFMPSPLSLILYLAAAIAGLLCLWFFFQWAMENL